MSKTDLNFYLSAYRGEGKFPLVQRVMCADGFSISVQAHYGAYSSPRDSQGPWAKVECGFPSSQPELIMDYVEDAERPTETVYGYVPIYLVEQLIDLHGGYIDPGTAEYQQATEKMNASA